MGTPKASSHVFDPYSFCLVVAGLILHLVWGSQDFNTWILGFLAALGLELAWEIIGNSPVVVARIRSNNGTCGEYSGDSIQNIIGDLLSCSLGYIIGTTFAALDLWWLSLVWILLNLLTLLVHSDKLVCWQ